MSSRISRKRGAGPNFKIATAPKRGEVVVVTYSFPVVPTIDKSPVRHHAHLLEKVPAHPSKGSR